MIVVCDRGCGRGSRRGSCVVVVVRGSFGVDRCAVAVLLQIQIAIFVPPCL